jgi:hypothetical protein
MKAKSFILVLAAVIGWGAASGEYRVWTGNTGSQLKAELVEETGGKVILRAENGRVLRVPRSYLVKEDVAYLDSLTLPVLGIRPDIEVESRYLSGAGVVQVVKHSIEIRKVSSLPYSQPVEITMFLVGTIGSEPTYVVLQRTQDKVAFTAVRRNPVITGPDLSLGTVELQKKYDVDYVGHLILATAPDGRIITIESDNKILEANAGFIARFQPGDLFGKDMQLLE